MKLIYTVLGIGLIISGLSANPSILIDNFSVNLIEQTFDGPSAESGSLQIIFDVDIIGGGRSVGRRQFDQDDIGDFTSVGIGDGYLSVEIIDTVPTLNRENEIGITYGSTFGIESPLDLNLSTLNQPALRFEFLAVPIGLSLGVEFSTDSLIDEFQIESYTVDSAIFEIPLSDLKSGLVGLDQHTAINDIDYMEFRFETDDSGYTQFDLSSISIVPEPNASLWLGGICACLAGFRFFLRRRIG